MPLLRLILPTQELCTHLLLAAMCLMVSPLYAQTRWDNNTADRSRSVGFEQSYGWSGSDWLGSQGQQSRPQWQFGVSGENRTTGVLVRSVSPNSAAARARIEPGDLIVNVAGFQVGEVAGRVYDLAEEINRRADASGNVSIIIQDHVSGRLAAVPVSLDNYNKALSGVLSYRERVSLPLDAVVTVQIENITRPYWGLRNGTTQFRPTPGANIPFEIAYDVADVNQQDNYQVRAFVTSGGRTILDTPQPQRVLTNGATKQVQLVLAPVLGAISTAGNAPSTGGVVSAGYPNYNTIDEQLKTMYRKYLNRDPNFGELAALRVTPGIESRMATLPLDIMAGQEYFDGAGNNDAAWLEKAFSQIVKRPPSQTELQQWLSRYADLRRSRIALLNQLYSVVNR